VRATPRSRRFATPDAAIEESAPGMDLSSSGPEWEVVGPPRESERALSVNLDAMFTSLHDFLEQEPCCSSRWAISRS
jgi:hypothetical protein